jgi:hypothetical protein
MVTVIQEQNPYAQAAERFGKGLSQGYINRSDEMALKNAVEKLGPDAKPKDVLNALVGTSTYGKEAKQEALKNYMGVQEFEANQKKAEAQDRKTLAKETENRLKQDELKYNKQVRIEDKKEKEIQKEKKELDKIDLQKKEYDFKEKKLNEEIRHHQALETVAGAKNKPESAFEKKMAAKNAEELSKLDQEIPRSISTAETLQYLSDEIDNEGIPGFIGGLVGTEKGTEIQSLGFTVIEPIFKLLNPGGGPLAQYKVKEAQNKFAVKATDYTWQKRAKIKALQLFNNQLQSRMIARKLAIESANGLLSEKQSQQFDREDEQLSDAFLDYDIAIEAVPEVEIAAAGLPPANTKKNKALIDPATKIRYESDGVRWIKK